MNLVISHKAFETFQHKHHVFHLQTQHSTYTPQRYHLWLHCSELSSTKDRKRMHLTICWWKSHSLCLDCSHANRGPHQSQTPVQLSHLHTRHTFPHHGHQRFFYLNTPMEHPRFTHLKYDHLPKEAIDAYSLAQKVLGSWLYV